MSTLEGWIADSPEDRGAEITVQSDGWTGEGVPTFHYQVDLIESAVHSSNTEALGPMLSTFTFIGTGSTLDDAINAALTMASEHVRALS
jgi:hypothetical protein